MRGAAAVFVMGLFALATLHSDSATVDGANGCVVGSYRFADGHTVDVAPSGDDKLRWRLFTGETGQLQKQPDGSWSSTLGWTNRSDGRSISLPDCDYIRFGNQSAERIPFDRNETSFESGGVTLAGCLIMPKG